MHGSAGPSEGWFHGTKKLLSSRSGHQEDVFKSRVLMMSVINMVNGHSLVEGKHKMWLCLETLSRDMF